MTREELFAYELNLIADSSNRRLVIETLKNAPEYFFKIPASSTGKYHPGYCLGDGGLVRHVKAAVRIAETLLSIEQHQNLAEDKDMIYAALILHDCCKNGIGKDTWSYTKHEHPLVASNLVYRTANDLARINLAPEPDFVRGVQKAIESHMGQWNTGRCKTDPVLPKPSTVVERFVHMCDYLASRKMIEVNFNVEDN